jgi:7,8-dihydropterin-6-yl-methyl-4-(beta-D-ribofuranosyl)aminobenzene 5'-phosphate synthase
VSIRLVVVIGSLALCNTAPASERVKLPEVDALEVQTVVDNFYDCFQRDEKCAKRYTWGQGEGFESIRVQGEMGLAFVVTATIAGKQHVLLFDFGLSPEVYENNLKHLKVDVSKAEALLLSHGHQDHYGGLEVALKQTHAPFYVGGEDAFAHRMSVTPTKTIDMDRLDRKMIEKSRKVVIASRPEVVAGVALSSGEIARHTDYEKVPVMFKMEKNGVQVPDLLTHEQALIFNVKGKGLVIITSCAHSGVINTIEHARAITGEKRVLAVIGGMHLTSASDDVINKTVQALEVIHPAYLAPMHCTGNRALVKMTTQMPDAYVHQSVGTRYVFQAGEVSR